MEPILEVILSLLAVVGLVGLGWLALGRMLAPAGGSRACWVLPAAGDGEGLEQAVRGLAWLRCTGLAAGPILLLDRGLSLHGVALAERLCRQEPQVYLCRWGELEEYIDL